MGPSAIPFQHPAALLPSQSTPPRANYPGSPTSGLSTPCPNGHSDPCYYDTHATTPLRHHSNAMAGCFMGGVEAAMPLFDLDHSVEGRSMGAGHGFGGIRGSGMASLGLCASEGALPSGLSGEPSASHSF
eukprot:scaffold227019_cov17-Tisochrysis_lutea.AAC.1